ncbi:MAG: alkaline phosphatase family protein [Actinomycetota bacterium]|nr:alkaline phosphatase family protein [Actinomycetota bacterium]
MTQRVLLVAGAAIVAAALAVAVLAQDEKTSGDRGPLPTLDEMADSIGSEVMLPIQRGHVPGRSAEVFLVPKPHFYLAGDWDLTTLGTDDPWVSTAHPSPWRYVARVPLIFYGPGHIQSGKQIYDSVDLTDVAPTYAQMLNVDGLNAEGEVLRDVPVPGSRKRPRVILSVVIDGGGWNALQRHPDSWPTIARLGASGVSYLNATIGSAPSITGSIHANIGTGVYPITHGIPGNQMRAPDGSNIDTWLEDADGRYLRSPTVSELWDEQNANKPIVGTISYEGWHLGMIGAGAGRVGGDKDVAALWDVEIEDWWINEEYYEFPKAARTNDLDELESYERRLDPRDGLKDGDWFDHTLEELQEDKVRPGTPAFVRLTGDVVVETMREAAVGRDDLTDMFWVEMKMPDFAGHLWNVEFAEQADVLRETDNQINRFVAELDKLAGRGNYVVMISADHGQQPLPDYLGGWRINTDELQRDVQREFGDVVEKVTTTDIFFDMDAIENQGIDLDDVARWLGTYTIGENIPAARPGSNRVPRARLEETIFAGAFSTDYLQALTEEKIDSFGESDYEEGSFTISRGAED